MIRLKALKVNQKVLSKKYYRFGGQDRGVAKTLIAESIAHCEPAIDRLSLINLELLQLNKLQYILFEIRPDKTLSDAGLVEAPIQDYLECFHKARKRVKKMFGDGLRGLHADLSNIDQVSIALATLF